MNATTLPLSGPADKPEDTQEYPIGCHVFGTAIAIESTETKPRTVIVNRDMLPGGLDREGKKYFWGIRVTIPGTNGYKHEPWVGFQQPGGTACSSWGGVPENSTMTWVRGESIEALLASHPDDHGPSR